MSYAAVQTYQPQDQSILIQASDLDIPEDSSYRKILACIPLIGIISTVLNERSLASQIRTTLDSSRLIKLISVKNDYKKASIARILLTVALFVTGVACGIFSGSIGVTVALLMGCIALHAYNLHRNRQLINRVQSGHIHSDMYVR